MTTSPFHFPTLVWDWPIAIYLFLIGISAGLVTLSILLRRFHPTTALTESTTLRTTLWVAPLAVAFGLLILILHLARPWTFWKLMFHYNFSSVMSMGVMLFQVYMTVLILWLALLFQTDLLRLQQRWLPGVSSWFPRLMAVLQRVYGVLEWLMLILAILLGAYTGFLLSALQSYPLLNNPILPALFLFSGLSSAAALITLVQLWNASSTHHHESHFIHRLEALVMGSEIFLLAAFFIGMWLGDDGKQRALVAALGGGFWTQWFWLGVIGLGFVIPLLTRSLGWQRRRMLLFSAGCSLLGVLFLRFFILYAGQLTVA